MQGGLVVGALAVAGIGVTVNSNSPLAVLTVLPMLFKICEREPGAAAAY
jgi:hypothetical protein